MTPAQAKEKLDAHVRETVEWHFNPETGTPVLAREEPRTAQANSIRARRCKGFDDLKKFGLFEDEWLRGGPVPPLGAQGPCRNKPIYVFETGGTTGIPKSRVVVEDFRIDYEMFSDTLPDKYFPKGSNWLMLGPSGPRRLRLAVEHLCQHRGGICFCVDLDPRWVIKLIKKGWMEHLKAYKEHVIDQAHDDPLGRPRHQVHVHHAQAARSPGRPAGKGRFDAWPRRASPASSPAAPR